MGQMEINHRRSDLFMAEQFLDGVEMGSGFQDVGGKGMALMPSSA